MERQDIESEAQEILAQVCEAIRYVCNKKLACGEECQEGFQRAWEEVWKAVVLELKGGKPIRDAVSFAKVVTTRSCNSLLRQRYSGASRLVDIADVEERAVAPEVKLDATIEVHRYETLVRRFLFKTSDGKRQWQAWQLQCEGYTRTEIAKACGVSSLDTVSKDIAKVKQWLQTVPMFYERVAQEIAGRQDRVQLSRILSLWAQGETQVEIARRLSVSPSKIFNDCAYLLGIFLKIATERRTS